MADFKTAFKITDGHEGGYANNPADTGGETYRGVARNHWPKWAGWPIIDAIKKVVGTTAKRINDLAAKDKVLALHVDSFYKTAFWDVNKLDQILNQAIASEIYDTGVNMGTGKAARILQEALNLTNRNGRDYKDTAVDGKIGPETIRLTNSHPNPKLLLKMLNALQAEHYINIMRKNPTQEIFANSWFSRVTV